MELLKEGFINLYEHFPSQIDAFDLAMKYSFMFDSNPGLWFLDFIQKLIVENDFENLLKQQEGVFLFGANPGLQRVFFSIGNHFDFEFSINSGSGFVSFLVFERLRGQLEMLIPTKFPKVDVLLEKVLCPGEVVHSESQTEKELNMLWMQVEFHDLLFTHKWNSIQIFFSQNQKQDIIFWGAHTGKIVTNISIKKNTDMLIRTSDSSDAFLGKVDYYFRLDFDAFVEQQITQTVWLFLQEDGIKIPKGKVALALNNNPLFSQQL